MSTLSGVLDHNKQFVEKKSFEQYQTSKFPNKRIVILTCMDTRLIELLPSAMNLKQGDMKMVKNAGAVVSHPFGSIMRSIIVATYELQSDEVYVIGHHDCGMSKVDSQTLLNKSLDRGVKEENIKMLEHAGIDLHGWLKGFNSPEEKVKNSVNVIKHHPLLPKDVKVHGLVIDPNTGGLDLVVDGNK
jgi:carbonic anhydrase